ncbi:H-NS histone family protein [Paraburkholderia youngii]|uniref:H-NS histone family protein n=1 Tax=Paraburkholderia youngii TaxID=2782701 RepID=UPI003D19EF8A
MATFKELQAQMAVLEEQTAAARAAEFGDVPADIRATVTEYGFSERDILGLGRGGCSSRHGGVAASIYCGPKTEATGSGRGRAPNWIKDAKDRDRYLIRD